MKSYSRQDIDRVVFISDIHLGVRNASIEWAENTVMYFDNFFFPLIDKYLSSGEKIIIVIAGDFFDNRKHIDIKILDLGVQIMKQLAERCEVFVLAGNHDIYKRKETDVTSLVLYKHFDNVNVIDEVSSIVLPGVKQMILVPWIGDHSEETKILANHKNDEFIIMHTDISGLKFDNGREIIDGANINVIENGKIYSGHIHKRQENDKVVYLGSPYQLRRSDIGNEKGIYSLIFTKKEDVKQEFVLNDYSPKFLRLRLIDILNLTISDLKSIIKNNYVDIIIKRSHKDDINIAKLMEAMDLCSPKKIEIILDKNDDEENIDDNNVISKDMSISDIFDSYISQFDLTEEEVKILKTMNTDYLLNATEALGSDIEIK